MDRPKVLALWDEPEHDPVSLPPDVSGLDLEDAVEAIEQWFSLNFEDPVHSMPYNGREGGYLYIRGGPYDAREIIEHVFDGLSEEVIEAAIGAVESESTDWVPNESRWRPEHEPLDEPAPPADPAALHAEMLRKLSGLDEVIQALPMPPAGIGHNNPPEQIEPIPYTSQDRSEIEAAVAALKAQPVTPSDEGKAAIEAAKALEVKGSKFRSWLARQADNLVTEFFKESGKELAKWGARTLFALLVERLFDVSTHAMKWLAALGAGLGF